MHIESTSVRPVALLVSIILLLSFSAAFAEDPPVSVGELWEVTSQLTMEGMPVGPPSLQRCDNRSADPAATDDSDPSH